MIIIIKTIMTKNSNAKLIRFIESHLFDIIDPVFLFKINSLSNSKQKQTGIPINIRINHPVASIGKWG